MHRGYVKRKEIEWNHTRHLMAFILNYAGTGTPKTPYQPKELVPLDLDKEQQKKFITTLRGAMDLLNEFKRWQG